VSFGLHSYLLSALAGLLTTLSPCVLPLIPVLVSTAVATHRLAAVSLALGVAASFAALGTLLAALGSTLGLNGETFRILGAVLLLLIGIVLLSSRLQLRLGSVTAGLSAPGDALLHRFSFRGVSGQFALGLLLGTVWSPCVGPTLGAAITLASHGQHLAQIALLMTVFGFCASLPMLLVGMLSHVALARARGSLHTLGVRGKQLLGIALIGLGILTVSHADRSVEAWLLNHSPVWLTELTTRY
jgi:cytochrome c-type biogenesis protein